MSSTWQTSDGTNHKAFAGSPKKIKQPSTQYAPTQARLCHPFHNQLLQHHQLRFQMLPNTTAKWKMKNRKLSQSAVFLPSVDVNTLHPASKMVMEMNEEAKIFCGCFFCCCCLLVFFNFSSQNIVHLIGLKFIRFVLWPENVNYLYRFNDAHTIEPRLSYEYNYCQSKSCSIQLLLILCLHIYVLHDLLFTSFIVFWLLVISIS